MNVFRNVTLNTSFYVLHVMSIWPGHDWTDRHWCKCWISLMNIKIHLKYLFCPERFIQISADVGEGLTLGCVFTGHQQFTLMRVFSFCHFTLIETEADGRRGGARMRISHILILQDTKCRLPVCCCCWRWWWWWWAHHVSSQTLSLNWQTRCVWVCNR